MTHTYNISGMICRKCVGIVKSELLRMGDILEAEIQLDSPQATITMQKHIPVQDLQKALDKAGTYIITELDGHMASSNSQSANSLSSYKPVFILGGYILGASLLAQLVNGGFDIEIWMGQFMAAFFLSFSFFKFLDLKGFAESYFSYDIIAQKWMGWGYIYAFIELGLGLAYLLHLEPMITNSVTFLVMGISIIGVFRSVLQKRRIQCACLGTVFNLPMSTITIIEDGLMIAMSGYMIIMQTNL
jgi:copper chaperone CopZ